MNRLEITNTGKLNYHLKMLNDLIAKNDQGAYILTERGKAAAELLKTNPSQASSTRTLKVFDAVIISLVGLLLTGIPVFIEFFILNASSSIPGILFLLYLLLIPSFVMWKLTTKRTNSHDIYELMKAPILALSSSYVLILLVLFLPRLLASPPPPLTNTTTTTQTLYLTPFVSYLIFPVIPLLGVLLIEGVYRLRSG